MACNFFSGIFGLGIEGYGGFIEGLWEYSFLFRRVLVEFTYEAILSWTFVCKELVLCCLFFGNYRFYFTSSDQSVKTIYFLIQFRWAVSRNLSISSRLSNLLAFNCSCYSLFCIFTFSVGITHFSFLILLTWVLSLFFLVNLARGLSILFTLSKNQLLVVLLNFFFCFQNLYSPPLWSWLFPSFCWL